jgi:hypothetical protein
MGSVKTINTVKASSVIDISTARMSSVRNISTVENEFSKKCQCIKNGFSQKYQYSKGYYRQTKSFSLTVIILTAGVCFFNIKIKSSSNMTVFDGEPRCHIDTCYLYPNEDIVFGIPEASHVSI